MIDWRRANVFVSKLFSKKTLLLGTNSALAFKRVCCFSNYSKIAWYQLGMTSI